MKDNLTCKECEKSFHYCGDCDQLDKEHAIEGFCCNECWRESREYNNFKEAFFLFYNKLDSGGKEFLWDLIEDTRKSYEHEIENWINEKSP